MNFSGKVNYKNHDVTLTWNHARHHDSGGVQHYLIESCTESCTRWTEVTKAVPASTTIDKGKFKFVHNNAGSSVERQYRIRAYNGTYWPAASWAVPAYITDIKITSVPKNDNTFRRGENIDVETVFNRNVDVTGTPKLHMGLGNDPANLLNAAASYQSGTGTRSLTFRYTVPANNSVRDTDGIQLYSNPLRIDEDSAISNPSTFTHTEAPYTTLTDWQALKPTRYVDGGNRVPVFTTAAGKIGTVAELVGDATEAVSRKVGKPIGALDVDTDDTLTFSLATGQNDFQIDSSTAQISTKVGRRYDFEANSTYSVLVRVTDGHKSTSSRTFRIGITDVNEPPLKPDAPSVSTVAGSRTSLDVSWTAPVNTGRPAITGYSLKVEGTQFSRELQVKGTSYTVTGLDENTTYAVTVRARNDEGDGPWSSATDQTTPRNRAPTASNRSVTTDEDTGYAFAASDFGFSDADTGDALASVTIVTLPAEDKGILELDETEVTADETVTKAELDDGHLVYTPPEDANGSGYASFTFKVSDGTAESASSFTMTVDVTAVNDPAGGAPEISGTAQVGQELTAAKGSVADVDGVPAESKFSWQWIRVDGATETALSGATGKTYRLVAADVDKQFKVKASFTDLDGTDESRTSEAWPASQVAANNAPTGANNTVEMKEDTAYTFAASDFGFADADAGDTLAGVTIVTFPASDKGWLTFDTDGLVYTPPANANGTGYASFTFKVSDGIDESASSYTMTMDVTAVDDPATGAPTISGTARVGQELTAAKGSVADLDGLPPESEFGWQWIRVDGETETPIQGDDARGKTYRLVAADAGKKLKVNVSFTDLDQTDENRTSDPTATVAANSAPTASNRSVTTNEDAAYAFKASDFGFVDADSGDALASVTIATLPASGKGSLALDGTAVSANKTVTKADLDAGDLVYTPPANANGSSYATFTFKVSDGTDASASSYTMTMDVTKVNDPATGAPAISGTAQVNNTLTAAKGSVADVDGLPPEREFSWQWIRVDGATETALSDATGKTYKLVAADADKKFKVKVSFTDLDGTGESRTSAAWPAGEIAANSVPTGADKTVTTNEDTEYAFKASDFGFSDADSGDTLASVTIATLTASGKGALTLNGTAVPANGTVTKAKLDANGLVYTPPANANGSGYASFTFRVSDGTDASASTYTMTVDVRKVNDPATGAPTISGTARVGQTLTAAKGSVADVDGLPAESAFSWQWLRVAGGGTGTEIPGATAKTYELVAADAGKKFEVKVSFTDLDGTGESRTSAAWPASQVAANSAPTGADKTVTTNEDTAYAFKAADFGFSDADSGDALASVTIAALPAGGKGRLALDGTAVSVNGTVTKARLDAGGLVYTPPANANGSGYASFTFNVSDGIDESASSYTMTMDVTAVNDPATGAPAISGTARVGQILTAAKGSVADLDGLPAERAFSWQWLRVDGGTDTAISGATAKTYRLVAADAGKKLKVKASFTDLDGTGESRTSDATGTVARNSAPTASNRSVTTNEDTAYAFRASNFGFSDADSGDALASVTIATLPASGKGSLALDGTAVSVNGTVTKAQIEDRHLVYTPPANANGSGYATFTFKVSDGTDASASTYTMTVDVTKVNDPATGAPAISGTARVGQTLTAAKGSVADLDGLPAESAFSWQWLRVDGGTDTEISGATAKTYQLVAADAGKKFKVKASFTDLDGTNESRTSAAWPASQVAANSAPTASDRSVTMDEDTAYTFAASDFGFADADSEDALASVTIATLTSSGKGSLALDGTAVSASGTVTKAELDAGDLVYTPPANANGTGYASFTFKVSDGIDASASSYTMTMDVTAVNDPATGAPAISGTARVGQTLTAAKGGVADVDGLPAESAFSWQWIRVDGGTDTAIPGADAKTYRLVDADAGKKFKVKASFTDLDGTDESRTSAAWPATQVAANGVPTGVDNTVTTNEDTAYTFALSDFDFTDADSGDALASVTIATLPADGKGTLALDGTAVPANGTVTKAELDAGDLVYTPPANANGSGYASFTFRVSDGIDASASSYTMTVDVTAVNDPATGAPTISGAARIGQELTAAQGSVADVDGLPAESAFSWQWLRVADGEEDTAIQGATGKTYRLVDADAGKRFKVTLSFTDLDGTDESRTSAAWPARQVAVNRAPTGADKTVTTNEDTRYAFAASDFGFADADAGAELASVTIATLPARGKGRLALDGSAVSANRTVTKAELDAGRLVYTPPANQHGDPYTSFTFRVSDGIVASASSYTMTVDVTAVNDPATGAPTISGPARVDQELTAAQGSVADVDGLPPESEFSWQWLRVDGGTDTAIPGATNKTYRLVDADAGKKFKVTLSFTDLDGTDESRTSAVWPAEQLIQSAALLDAHDSEATLPGDENLVFRVTLEPSLEWSVSVNYATRDITAEVGLDYTATSGTLTFSPGETEKTVEVPLLEDPVDEGTETIALVLSEALGARIGDGEATGSIHNTGPTPLAWVSRFGRTVAGQLLDAVEGRIRAARTPGVEVSLAGERIGRRLAFGQETDEAAAKREAARREAEAERAAARLAAWLKGEIGEDEDRQRSRTVAPQELMFGSSFELIAEPGGPGSGEGFVSVWGRGAVSRFDGQEDELALDGEVASGLFGLDWSRDGAIAGLIIGYSTGEGGYRAPSGAGEESATLAGVYPWGRYAVDEHIEVWGAAGYGEGTMTLTPVREDEIRTDLDLWMVAAGLRGTLLDGGADGLTFMAKTDAMTVTTSTDAVPGDLAATEARVTRLRLGLEGTRPVRLVDRAVLTPSVELGVRHDGGAAETGLGTDVGAGLAWVDPARGLSAELRGRGLLTHKSKSFRDRGISGAFAWGPSEDGRGPRLSLTQTFGGASSGGADALLERRTVHGLAANDDGGEDLSSRRLAARFGYGFAAFADGFTWTPEAGIELSDTGRDYSLGWRLVRIERGFGIVGRSLDLSFRARRREVAANDAISQEHDANLRLTSRF